MNSVIDFVKSLSIGPCSCAYNMGSFNVSYDYATGKSVMSGDKGPRTHHCTRCRAREALERDGIEYVKDDTVHYVAYNGMNACAAPSLMPEGSISFVTTGSLMHAW